MIFHDENRIKQVLLNLQSNAIKFTEKGHVIIRVSIVNNREGTLSQLPRYYDNEDQFLRISVEDTGVGIKK